MSLYKLSWAVLGSLLVFCTAQAQETCIIRGTLQNDSLCYAPKRVEKVYLTGMDEYERFYPLDSAVVKQGSFEFKRMLKADEPVLLYFITGFDNGSIPVFLEPGEVDIVTPQAAYPGGSRVSGTRNNDLFRRYNQIAERCVQLQNDSIHAMVQQHGREWVDSEQGARRRMQLGAEALIACNADRIDFLLQYNDAPFAVLMMEREIHHLLDRNYAEQLLNSVSPQLHSHPYYRSFRNAVRAQELKVGGELPDITLPLADGQTMHLSDYRGRYVLLDFWASWCGPCIRELPYLKQVYEESRLHKEGFSIISFSLDNKEEAWRAAMKSKDIVREGWIHASDLLGWSSPAARMLGITAIPHIILVDPEGKAISFSLRGEEMVARVKQILSGDLYYLEEGK